MNNATDPATTHSCRVAAGPGKCAAIAKKKGTRVWLCNDVSPLNFSFYELFMLVGFSDLNGKRCGGIG